MEKTRLGEALVTQKLSEGNNEIDRFGLVLQSFTQELQRVAHQLTVTSDADAEKEGLSHVSKITEIHATVELISTTLLQSKMEVNANEPTELVQRLNLEVSSLKQELKEAKIMLAEGEKLNERLKVDLETFESLALSKKQGNKYTSIHDAERRIISLEATVKSLEISLENMNSQLEVIKKEKIQAVNNQKVAVSQMEKLMEKKIKLKNQLKMLRDEEERSKKVVDRLTSVIYDVLFEVREVKEKLFYTSELVEKLKFEKATWWEAPLMEAEKVIQQLKMEVEIAKKAESEASQSVASVMKQQGEQNVLLQDARSEISALKEKLESVRISLEVSKEEGSKMGRIIETLKSELQTAKEEKQQALSNAKQFESEVQTMAEERKKLISELETLKKKKEITERKREALIPKMRNPSNPIVFFDISIGGALAGRILMELFADVTPRTADNFREICIGGKIGTKGKPLHYKGSKLHWIASGDYFIGGNIISESGIGGESIYGIPFTNENYNNKHMGPGTLYMWNKTAGGNTSMFLLSMNQTWTYSGEGHVVYGHVVEGMDVASAIVALGNAGVAGGAKEVMISDCGQLF